MSNTYRNKLIRSIVALEGCCSEAGYGFKTDPRILASFTDDDLRIRALDAIAYGVECINRLIDSEFDLETQLYHSVGIRRAIKALKDRLSK